MEGNLSRCGVEELGSVEFRPCKNEGLEGSAYWKILVIFGGLKPLLRRTYTIQSSESIGTDEMLRGGMISGGFGPAMNDHDRSAGSYLVTLSTYDSAFPRGQPHIFVHERMNLDHWWVDAILFLRPPPLL